MCVLLIDDDDIFRVIFKKIFISNEICDEVNSVKNGLEAFNNLKLEDNKGEYWPEAIFVDINMPIMNGWEFLDLYKSHFLDRHPNSKIWIVTSSISPDDHEKGREYSFLKGFIQKPFNQGDITMFKAVISNN